MDTNIRGWTFTHWWVRPVVKVWFGLYHQSVSYSGQDHINWDHPIIFAPNHQNAFSDALCLILPTSYTNNRFIYPLIRADAFGNNAALDWVLTTFHMMPVYRPRDRVNIKEKNDAVFQGCYDVLSQKRNLLIHPEGNCIAEKRVRPFKKGIARIALGAEQQYDFNLNLDIIPTGINYRDITEPRKGIHVQFGEPLSVANYQKQYNEHRPSALSQLTGDIQKGVEQLTVNIQDRQHYEFLNHIMTVARSAHVDFAGRSHYSKEEVVQNKAIAHFTDDNPNTITELKNYWRSLSELLDKYKLSFGLPLVVDQSVGRLVLEGFSLFLLFPLAIVGEVAGLLPWMGMQKIASAIDEEQFKSSARMVSGLLLFPANYLLEAVFVWWLSESWEWTLLCLIGLPLVSWLSLNFWERAKRWRQKVRLMLLEDQKKEKLNTMLNKLRSLLKLD
ncbi:1-acyl-sn-glycerol-3-phosphate acyltransferase [Fodinibius salinus]|uniref:1-acyl-sn-glycerol-3-phosphate acyltransferase n=1 Tax=Fodinibius salinus TaxID=860790 RepID=A0A5D3YIW8_9BACT|nr:1-acyl-sn-glycerol-3-phosphate acyltransferase [Fodinibius salinus]TYP93784.1 1-acyl-sn-glycerol-3-phosphate acyltransferase [Fodinibius salinus]